VGEVESDPQVKCSISAHPHRSAPVVETDVMARRFGELAHEPANVAEPFGRIEELARGEQGIELKA
jgi:hypothetical protein